MDFKDWRNNFITTGNREELLGEWSAGSPLYAYKLSAIEFEDLKSCLTYNIKIYFQNYDLNLICKMSKYFPPLFVLYASMWWQREYDGTGMCWDPIFTSIGIDYENLDSNLRSEMIKRGFEGWNLTLNSNIGNLKYIGNIASQGGLPLKLVAAGRGNINRLLSRVLKDTVNLAFADEKSVLSIIESHKSELPRSYRQPLIFSLLAEIIITFVHLKNDANLSGATNPLEKLDQYKSNWRDSFPLPMDDENARGVLERFIQEGVRIKAEKPAFILMLQRYLQTLDGVFNVVARIDLPKSNIDQESVIRAFDIDEEFITRVMHLQVSNQIESHEITLGRLAGQANYRFNSETTPLFKHANNEHTATFKNANNQRKAIALNNGFELDDDTPWVFDADPEGDEGKFLKVGAGKFKSARLYVVLPTRFSLSETFEPTAYSVEQDKKCYVIDAPVTCLSDEGERYEIMPSCSDADEEEFSLIGNRMWHVFQKPSIAFRGYPQAVKYISTTPLNKRQTNVTAFCKNLDNKLLSPALGVYGPLNLSVKENNSSVWASKIVALPANADYQINPGDDANHGSISLNNWGVSNVRCLDKDVTLKANINNDIFSIECSYTGTTTPNELVSLELFWLNNQKTAIIKLPFPSSGVIAFDAEGHRIDKHKTLSLRQLYGVRIISLLSQGNFVEIALRLIDTGNIRIEPTSINLKRDRDSTRVEIRLIDFKEQISDLLYAVDSLDSKVEVRVKVVGAKDFILFINKYDIEFEHNIGNPIFQIKQLQLSEFSNEAIERCEVMATRLDQADDVVPLVQSVNQGVFNGIWKFPIHQHPNGCWMVHPSTNSSIQFRSMILPLTRAVKEDQDELDNDLKCALNIANDNEREAAINLILEELVLNFNHKDWLHIEYLAQNLGHLNLTSLHLWRLFAKNKRAMAALALRDSKYPDQFIQRFAAELPFLWELVSIEAWLDAAFYLKKQVFQQYKDESFAQQYFEYLLQNKLNGFLVEHPSLKVIFEVVLHKNKLAVSLDMQRLLESPQMFGDLFAYQLFGDENSELQKLLRTDEQDWPSYFFNEIRAFKHSDHQDLMCQQDFTFKDSVINFPFVVAINCLTQELPAWLADDSAFLDLKRLKKFNEDWFDSAFDMTIARAITLGYVHL